MKIHLPNLNTIAGASAAAGVPAPSPRVKSSKRRVGAVTLELALVAPVFFFMVFGIIEIGRGFMVSHLLANAARDGCRTGVIAGTTTTQIKSVVSSDLTAQGVSGSTVSVSVNGDATKDASAAAAGDMISVLITIPVSSFTWLPGGTFMKGSISGQFTIRRE